MKIIKKVWTFVEFVARWKFENCRSKLFEINRDNSTIIDEFRPSKNYSINQNHIALGNQKQFGKDQAHESKLQSKLKNPDFDAIVQSCQKIIYKNDTQSSASWSYNLDQLVGILMKLLNHQIPCFKKIVYQGILPVLIWKWLWVKKDNLVEADVLF